MRASARTLFPRLLLAAALVACGGDDDGDDNPAADAGPDVDAADDADASTVAAPSVTMVPLSPTGTDALFGVTFAADGSYYATGFRADGVESSADRSFVLAHFLATGELDAAFGDDGIAAVNVRPGGTDGESARGIVIQSDGKIVVAGVVEHDVTATGTAAKDRDIAVVRFDATGALDDTFGDEGVAIFDLGTGVEVTGTNGPTLSGVDLVWSLSLAGDDRLLIHGAQRTPAAADDPARTDSDFMALRLTADGARDEGFGTDGVFTLDLQQVNATPKAALVLADGSVIAGGYANTPGLGSTQPVVYKLTPAGELDTEFGTGGVFHQVVLPAITEVYDVAVIGDQIVTAGYGRSGARDDLDWISLRLDADGTLDASWGEAGAVTIDHAGFNDNCRAITALPGGGVLLVGGGRSSDELNDAAAAMLDASGEPVASFGTGGRQVFDLGGSGDMFWDAVVSPDGSQAIAVGHKGAGGEPSASDNDDAAVLVVPLE